ncbi:unnamed protein product [Acanthosepion pharaonis]|uniref:Uncharacterized protein n=1 Tax=Acanthosepion pharaonis TaxID=158019 RepID=A0A812BK18_ACAPH|nr:unnamed protein product [Sepia pharaonis]
MDTTKDKINPSLAAVSLTPMKSTISTFHKYLLTTVLGDEENVKQEGPDREHFGIHRISIYLSVDSFTFIPSMYKKIFIYLSIYLPIAIFIFYFLSAYSHIRFFRSIYKYILFQCIYISGYSSFLSICQDILFLSIRIFFLSISIYKDILFLFIYLSIYKDILFLFIYLSIYKDILFLFIYLSIRISFFFLSI